MTIPTCLTIAGSDSGGEAGIQADLQVFRDFNVHGTCAITANTAQNPKNINSVNPVPTDVLKDQIIAITDYFNPSFTKTGLLVSNEQITTIAETITKKTIIADPIMISTSGKEIMTPGTIEHYKQTLIPRALVLTPNWPEATVLTGIKITNDKCAIDAIKYLHDHFGCNVYLKGGHSDSPGIDYLHNGQNTWKLCSPEINIKSSHGTGCRLSSAICSSLANGQPLLEAAIKAKNYVYRSLLSCKLLNNNSYMMSSPGLAATLQNSIEVDLIK